jgi:tRNA threonylcarbamoyladenosine biosynthesis protein TsaE
MSTMTNADGELLAHFDLATPQATQAVARALGDVASVGDVLLLSGELGAGKTTLVRALVGALGHDVAMVSSPTFVLMNRYATPGQITVLHVDAYRLTGSDDLDTIGWDDALQQDAVLAVEWPERIAPAIDDLRAGEPSRVARLRLSHAGEHARLLELRAPAGWARRPAIGRMLALASRVIGHAGGATRCPVTGQPVAPGAPHWPFASEQARLADLGRWLSGAYVIGRPLDEQDADDR